MVKKRKPTTFCKKGCGNLTYSKLCICRICRDRLEVLAEDLRDIKELNLIEWI